MSFATSIMSNAAKKLAAACALVLVLAGASAAVAPQVAYADTPTYSMSVLGDGSSIAPGDTFTVSLNLDNNEGSSYTMYAMSATVRYDTSMLEVVSMDMNNGIDVYTASAGGGWTQVVLNFKARTLKGTTWNNGSLMDITFRALGEGSTSVMITRANISNSTGRGSYPCACSDAVVAISTSGGGISSDDNSQGSTSGVDAPEADPSTLTDEELEMTDEERAEYEATKNGELVVGASSSSASASASASKGGTDSTSLSGGDKAAADGDTPTLLYVLVGCFVAAVVILVVGIAIYKRRK